ncbi:MAG: DUF2064 domain-containing protein, partial [Bacteroidota bacterium]
LYENVLTLASSEAVRVKTFSYKLSKRGNQLIADRLINHSTRLAQKVGVDFFVFTEKEQNGEQFGERLASAFQQVFDKGYHRVISIGNDCPTLDLPNLQQAIIELQGHDVVVGPAKDGGVYLLGLTSNEFKALGFEHLKWKTDQLVEDIFDKLTSGARIKLLDSLADIDHDKGLNEFLIFSASELASRIKSLLQSFQSQWYGAHINTYVGKLIAQGSSRRGPPPTY